MSDRIHAAIVGGGIGGLAAANALLHRGLSVAVYEQASALGEVGAGVFIYPNSLRQLERMGLGHREKALPTQLSAGEQQRVGIARAIIAEPRLLVADEPTGNLDPTLSAEIMELFAGLPDRGTSVLVVSHDLPLLRRMRKRVLVLDHGRLVDDISPQDLAE